MDKQLIYKAHYGPADGPFKILLKKNVESTSQKY